MADYNSRKISYGANFHIISYVPAVCENKSYENLNVQNFSGVINNAGTLTCTTHRE